MAQRLTIQRSVLYTLSIPAILAVYIYEFIRKNMKDIKDILSPMGAEVSIIPVMQDPEMTKIDAAELTVCRFSR